MHGGKGEATSVRSVSPAGKPKNQSPLSLLPLKAGGQQMTGKGPKCADKGGSDPQKEQNQAEKDGTGNTLSTRT